MRKYRIVLTLNGRKLTRHVRAQDAPDARRQAEAIAYVLAPGAPLNFELYEMGNVGRRVST